MSNESHILRYWGLEIQHEFWGTQLSPLQRLWVIMQVKVEKWRPFIHSFIRNYIVLSKT